MTASSVSGSFELTTMTSFRFCIHLLLLFIDPLLSFLQDVKQRVLVGSEADLPNKCCSRRHTV